MVTPESSLPSDFVVINSLRYAPRYEYFNVVVQVITVRRSVRGAVVMKVWDGAPKWSSGPLIGLHECDIVETLIPPSPTLAAINTEASSVDVFCYDYENHLKEPIESGDWVLLRNCKIYSARGVNLYAFTMHSGGEQYNRSIIRLSLPPQRTLPFIKILKKHINNVLSYEANSDGADASETAEQAETVLESRSQDESRTFTNRGSSPIRSIYVDKGTQYEPQKEIKPTKEEKPKKTDVIKKKTYKRTRNSLVTTRSRAISKPNFKV